MKERFRKVPIYDRPHRFETPVEPFRANLELNFLILYYAGRNS